jgi:hypothetical protein
VPRRATFSAPAARPMCLDVWMCLDEDGGGIRTWGGAGLARDGLGAVERGVGAQVENLRAVRLSEGRHARAEQIHLRRRAVVVRQPLQHKTHNIRPSIHSTTAQFFRDDGKTTLEWCARRCTVQ